MRLLQVCFVVLMSSLVCGQQNEELLAQRESAIATSAAILGQEINLSRLLSAYNNYARPSDAVVQVQMFTSRELAAKITSGKRATDLDESKWYERYLAALANYPRGAMAEVLQVGPDLAARFMAAGHVRMNVIKGNNPYLCESTSNDCEIVWLTIGRIPPGEEGYSVGNPMMYLFVKTKARISREAGLLTADKLRIRFKSKFMVVAFRSDEWFVGDLEFPLIYPFWEIPSTIDSQAIKVRDDLLCVAFNEHFSCG